MEETLREAQKDRRRGLFAPLGEARTYVNMIYLLLAFPLGIFYFVFLVTGLSVGISLLIVWIGIPVLLFMLVAWQGLAAFEREQAIRLLRVDIPPMKREAEPVEGLWQRLKAALRNPVTWKGLAFLFAKFPLGIFTFTALVTLVSVSLAFIATPFIFPFAAGTIEADFGSVTVDTFPEALLLGVVGVGLAVLTAHATNWMAYALAWFARVMLGDPKAVPEGEPSRGPEPVALPEFRMTPQTRAVLGITLVGLGAWAFINQFLPAVGSLFAPLFLIVIGLVLIVPRAREALSPDKPAEAENAADR